MNPIAIAVSVSVPAAFAAGVLFHKYVISEAAAIKQHVTAEAQQIRSDISGLLAKAAAKV